MKAIRAAVEVLAANLAKWASSSRKADHRGSLEVGCGMVVVVVSAVVDVVWDALSELLLVAVEADEEVVWDDVRGSEVSLVMFFKRELRGSEGGNRTPPSREADAWGLSVESDTLEELEVEMEREDVLLTNTLCGLCLIFVR